MHDALAASPPQLYLDFTNDAKSYSQEMAKVCVRRDVEAYQQYLSSIVRLRLLDHYVEQLGRNAQRRASINTILDGATSGPSYLQGLLLLQFEPAIAMQIQAQAMMDETRIREANKLPREEGQLEDDEEDFAWLDEIAGSAETDLERVVNLLVEGQRGNALNHFISWY